MVDVIKKRVGERFLRTGLIFFTLILLLLLVNDYFVDLRGKIYCNYKSMQGITNIELTNAQMETLTRKAEEMNIKANEDLLKTLQKDFSNIYSTGLPLSMTKELQNQYPTMSSGTINASRIVDGVSYDFGLRYDNSTNSYVPILLYQNIGLRKGNSSSCSTPNRKLKLETRKLLEQLGITDDILKGSYIEYETNSFIL